MMHLDHKHMLWIGVAVAGVAGLYLLTHRGGAASAGSADSLPQTGPPPLGNQTPSSPSYYDAGEAAAAANSLSDRFRQLAQANAGQQLMATEAQFGVGAVGSTVSKGWRQIQGGWADIAHPGHYISEDDAARLGPQNHGPYAEGSGGFFGQVGKFVSSLTGAILPNIAAAASGGTPITVGTAFLGPKKPKQPAYNGPWAPNFQPTPSPALSYGNPPARF